MSDQSEPTPPAQPTPEQVQQMMESMPMVPIVALHPNNFFPLPFGVDREIINTPQGKMILVTYITTAGLNRYAFPLDFADQEAKALRKIVREARLGLELPKQGLVMPDGSVHQVATNGNEPDDDAEDTPTV